jgi:hypothetical protein
MLHRRVANGGQNACYTIAEEWFAVGAHRLPFPDKIKAPQ